MDRSEAIRELQLQATQRHVDVAMESSMYRRPGLPPWSDEYELPSDEIYAEKLYRSIAGGDEDAVLVLFLGRLTALETLRYVSFGDEWWVRIEVIVEIDWITTYGSQLTMQSVALGTLFSFCSLLILRFSLQKL